MANNKLMKGALAFLLMVITILVTGYLIALLFGRDGASFGSNLPFAILMGLVIAPVAANKPWRKRDDSQA